MTKDIFLTVQIDKNKVVDPEWLARNLAQKLIESHDEGTIKNVQFRYGAFGKVDKIHSVQR